MLNVSGLILHKRGTTITKRNAQIIQKIGIQKQISINYNSIKPIDYNKNIAG